MEKLGKVIGAKMPIFGLILVFLCVGAWSVTSVYAEHRRACAEDIEKYCKDVKPCEGRLINCLKEHESKLSDECKGKIEGVKKRLEDMQQACSGDMKKFCGDVQPGKGRIEKCLSGHSSELSAVCRGKIECMKEEIEIKGKKE
jgi:hypothetical protein